MVYVVAYDLIEPNDTPQNYDEVATAIRSIGPWARIEQSVWLVSSVLMTFDVRDRIWKSDGFHRGDRLFVARLSGTWGSYNLSDEIVEWINEQAF